MPHARVNGLNLYYETHGESRDALVLVHGYTGDVTDWRFQIPEFSRTHRLLIMDLRGHGRSDAPGDRTAYTIESMADDVEALATHAGLSRYHLLGHSMGGAVTQEIALRSPERLLSLTLHDTSYNFKFTRSDAVSKFYAARNILAEQHGMAVVANLPSMTPPPPFMPPERLIEARERLARMSVDGCIGGWQALELWSGTKDRLHALRVPTLVIYGELDRPLDRAAFALSEAIPNATLEVVPQAAHAPQYERPDLFNRALRRHLDRHSAT